MSVLDCLYLVVSPPCSSLLSFPWTSSQGWKRSFLCPSFSKPSLTPCDLPSSWHGLSASSPHLSCPLSVCVLATRWDKTLSTDKLFFWGFWGVGFIIYGENRDVPFVGLSTNFSPFKPNINLCHSCLQDTLPWCPKGSSKFALSWFKVALAIIIKKKKEEITISSMVFFYKGMPSTLQEASPLIKQKKGQLKPMWVCPCSCWHHFK